MPQKPATRNITKLHHKTTGFVQPQRSIHSVTHQVMPEPPPQKTPPEIINKIYHRQDPIQTPDTKNVTNHPVKVEAASPVVLPAVMPDKIFGKGTVSIIVLASDGSKNTEASIGSILSQKYDDLEVIVVDGGSENNASLAVKKVSKGDPRVFVFRKPWKMTRIASLKFGLSQASGEFVSVMHLGDELHPGEISSLVGMLRADASIGCVLDEKKSIYIRSAITAANGLAGIAEDMDPEIYLQDRVRSVAKIHSVVRSSTHDDSRSQDS